MLTVLNGILIGACSLTALAVMMIWHFGDGRPYGPWAHNPAGRAIMGLLATIVAITGLATVSVLIGPWDGRAEIYAALYAVFVAALIGVGRIIMKAQAESRTARRDRRRAAAGLPPKVADDEQQHTGEQER